MAMRLISTDVWVILLSWIVQKLLANRKAGAPQLNCGSTRKCQKLDLSCSQPRGFALQKPCAFNAPCVDSAGIARVARCPHSPSLFAHARLRPMRWRRTTRRRTWAGEAQADVARSPGRKVHRTFRFIPAHCEKPGGDSRPGRGRVVGVFDQQHPRRRLAFGVAAGLLRRPRRWTGWWGQAAGLAHAQKRRAPWAAPVSLSERNPGLLADQSPPPLRGPRFGAGLPAGRLIGATGTCGTLPMGGPP